MLDLQRLLRGHGFEITDGPTLALFAIGKQHNVQAAVQCFLEFYKFASSVECRFPDLRRVEQLCEDGYVEGFACHSDGTAGITINVGNWNVHSDPVMYIVREMLCHLFHMANFSHLKNGLTEIANMRDLGWRSFAPFEIAKLGSYVTKCTPIFWKRLLIIDANYYASIAFSVVFKMLPNPMRDVFYVSSSIEIAEKFPNLLLPPSLTPSTKEKAGFCRLSVEEQMSIQLMVDY